VKPVRGYIFSRAFSGERVPQHVQNLVIREYCKQNQLKYLLSATEYAMPGSHLILDQALTELPRLYGIVAYSLFQLPEDNAARAFVFDTVLLLGKTLHFAVEGLRVETEKDVQRIESIEQVRKIVDGDYIQSDILMRMTP